MSRSLIAFSFLAILIALTLSGDHFRQRLAERGQPKKVSCRMLEMQVLPDFPVCSQEKP